MIDNITIEVISIIKRYFTINHNNDDIQTNNFFEKLLSSNLIDHLIFLLGKDNLIILKLLHILLISVSEK
jgi:hypothetical protein